MRLNLLPTTVKKTTQTRTALVLCLAISLASIGVAVYLVIFSGSVLAAAKKADEDRQPEYDRTVEQQKKAGAQLAMVAGLQRNIGLYRAMDRHVEEFPSLYRAVMPYIPNFFRLTELNAQASGANTVVTMTGVISTFQQYADLMLALLRIPPPYGQVVSISRTGFQHTEPFVPPIDELDPLGRPRRPGENPIPADPLQRLEYYVNQGAQTQTGYQALGNYGSGQPGPRGPRQMESLVTINLVLPHPIQTPDPRATLAQFGGGAVPGGTGGGAGGGPAQGGPRSAKGGG